MKIWEEIMADSRKYFKSKKITISFDPKLCTHVGGCVRRLPTVFDVKKRPWINSEGADPDRIAEVIQCCPSGALEFERHDEGPQEVAPAVTTVTRSPDGPIYVRGNIEVRDKDGNFLRKATRVALCGCGRSKNKPFCDETHRKVNFYA